MKYAHWTTFERRKLIEAHKNGCPTQGELAALFPRHSIGSVLMAVYKLGIRRNASQIRRLRAAHLYFQTREAEMCA